LCDLPICDVPILVTGRQDCQKGRSDGIWLNLFLVVLGSWFAGALVMRLGYPHVLGEVLAGIIFGPPLLGWIRGDAA
jgi:hypothetical protein